MKHVLSVSIFILCSAFSVGPASPAEEIFQWSTRITLSEQYDDNVDLDPDNEDHDWITSVGPGLSLSVLSEEVEVQFDYDFYYRMYARGTSDDELGHTLALTGRGIPISERLSLDLRDNLYISDDPIERQEGVDSTRRNRNRYYRNTAEGRLNYTFGREDSAYIGFQHVLLENDDPSVEDSQTYTPSAGVTYWFNIRNGVSLDFAFSRGEFDESEDYDQYTGTATYTYRFSSRTEIDLAYSYDSFDYDANGDVTVRDDDEVLEERDYQVHQGLLGLSHGFTEDVSGSIAGGYFFQDRERAKNKQGFAGGASLNIQFENGVFALDGAAGYRQQFQSAEDLGFSKFYRATTTLSYNLSENLTTSLSALYVRDEYEETTDNREDDTRGGRAGVNYSILDWLSASLDYEHRRRDSTRSEVEYTDNRVTLSIVAFYLSEPKPL